MSPGSFVNSPQSGLSPAEILIGTCSVNNTHTHMDIEGNEAVNTIWFISNSTRNSLSTATKTRSIIYISMQTMRHCNCVISLYIL